jgi:hypothetical protein
MQRQGRFGLGIILFLLAGCDSSGSKANGSGGSSGTAGAASGGSMTGPEAGAAAGTAGTASGGSMTTGGSGGRADAGATDRATEVCVAALKAYVEGQAFCQGGSAIDYRPYVGACPEFFFGPDSNRSVDDIAACLPELAAPSCDDVYLGISPACFRPGKRPYLAGCIFSSQCQSGECGYYTKCQGGVCSPGLDSCGFCNGRASIGSSCEMTHCGPDSYCDQRTRKCMSTAEVIHVAEGQKCDLSASPPIACASGLRCSSSGCAKHVARTTPTCGDTTCDENSFCRNKICVERAKLGQPCSYPPSETLPECALGLDCFNDKCIQRRAVGEPCDDANPCNDYRACVAGVCQVIVCDP